MFATEKDFWGDIPNLVKNRKYFENLIKENKKKYCNLKYCEALRKGTACAGLGKEGPDIVYCIEKPCLHDAGNRLIEKNFLDKKERFTCPSPTGLIKEVVTGKPKDKKTFLWN